mgnify:FL=1
MLDLGNNKQGKALSAKTINKGDNYGLNDCLTYNDADIYFKEKDPLIEFYRAATKETPAYFIGRYYRSTLMGRCEVVKTNSPAVTNGLCLCGSTGLTATAQQVQTACNAQGHELRLLAFQELQQIDWAE